MNTFMILSSCEILSAGEDGTLRNLNFAIEGQNSELSQKIILQKLGLHRRHATLPNIIGIDLTESKKRDWADIVTIHQNHSNAYLWRFKYFNNSFIVDC